MYSGKSGFTSFEIGDPQSTCWGYVQGGWDSCLIAEVVGLGGGGSVMGGWTGFLDTPT